jgi:hypothetical protein
MACGISAGFTGLTCIEQKTTGGGLKQDVYLANLDNIDTLYYDGDGNINSIKFVDTYAGLYKFTGTRYGNTTASDFAQTEGGNANFTHTVVLSLQDITAVQKDALEDLAYSQVVAIVESSAGRFEMFGYPLGLAVSSAVRNSGNTPQDTTNRLVTLTGQQSSIEKTVAIPDGVNSLAVATKAALESYLAA